MIILSILCATTPDRSEMFQVLYSELQRQHTYMKTFHPTLGDIEILVDDSKRFLDGGPSIGKKREALVQRAQGKYLCFIDSDDMIPGNYMETIVRACQEDKDVITFRAIARLENYWTIIKMSIWLPNFDASPEHDVERSPSIVCPVRSVYAKMVDFEDINHGEDYKWMGKVISMCLNESRSNVILYEYRHGQHSESDKIIKAGYV